MSQSSLPQLAGGLFMSDGGLETTLVFLDGVELPHFAAFVLLDDEVGRERLMRYYVPYLEMCAETPGAGFVLETPTWRASPDWARLIGFDEESVRRLNRAAAGLARTLANRWSRRLSGPIVVSGVIGPRGDGYRLEGPQSADDAARYHCTQAEALADGGVDMLSAVTMTNSAEALGVALAAERVGLPRGSVVHGRDRRETAERRSARRRDRHRRCAGPTGLLRGQLRAPEPLRAHPRRWGRVDRAHPCHPGKRFAEEPCRAR